MSETTLVSALPDAPDSFEHYGVKGMKWGVRKSRGAGSGPASSAEKSGGVVTTSKKLPDGKTEWHVKDNATGKVARAVTTRGDDRAKALVEQHAQKKISEAVGKSTEKATQPVKKLSDDDLKKAIERIELERKYATLTTQPVSPQASDKIKKAIADGGNEAVKNVTKNVAQALLMAAANTAVNKASSGKINLKPIADKKDDKKDDKKKD